MTNGWDEYKIYVEKTLDEHTQLLKLLHVDVIALKTRATMWGSVSGFLAGIAASILVSVILFHLL